MLPFEEEILEDIKWRNEQLLIAKTLPFLYSFSEDHKMYVIKHSIPMIYSIWEGYVQNTFQIYVRELNSLGLSRNSFCDNILFHSVEMSFPQLKEYPDDFGKRMKFVVKLNDYFDNPFSISAKISTQSNVELEVINKILKRFNLPELPNHPYRQQLKDLLFYRNGIAHGSNGIIVSADNLTDFVNRIEDFVVLVKDLMDLVLQIISKGYNVDKCYLKPII